MLITVVLALAFLFSGVVVACGTQDTEGEISPTVDSDRQGLYHF